MPKAKPKKRPASKAQRPVLLQKTKNYYAKNQYAYLVTTVVIIVIAVAIGLWAQAISQRNSINSAGKVLEAAKSDIIRKHAADDVKVEYSCNHYSPYKFEKGALYCGVSLTAKVTGSSSEELGRKYNVIYQFVYRKNSILDKVTPTRINTGEYKTDNGLTCSETVPQYFDELGGTQTEIFEMRCERTALYNFYRNTD